MPYEPNEITRMLAACDAIGNSEYERKRARAMVLLLRDTALRISDTATLRKDRIQNGRIFLHTKKTGAMVLLRVPKQLEDARSYRLRMASSMRSGRDCDHLA